MHVIHLVRMQVYVMAVRISDKLSHENAQLYEHYHPNHCLEIMLQQAIWKTVDPR